MQSVNVGPVLQTCAPVGPQTSRMVCRSCHSDIMTKVEHRNTSKTHIAAFVLFMIGCWPCCCIPYCMDSCRSTTHNCPNCNAYIGSYVA